MEGRPRCRRSTSAVLTGANPDHRSRRAGAVLVDPHHQRHPARSPTRLISLERHALGVPDGGEHHPAAAIGCVLDPPPAILMLTPLLMPLVKVLGIDPVHFGIMMRVNLAIGMFTAAVRPQHLGRADRCSACRWRRSIAAFCPSLWVQIAALLIITYWPGRVTHPYTRTLTSGRTLMMRRIRDARRRQPCGGRDAASGHRAGGR